MIFLSMPPPSDGVPPLATAVARAVRGGLLLALGVLLFASLSPEALGQRSGSSRRQPRVPPNSPAARGSNGAPAKQGVNNPSTLALMNQANGIGVVNQSVRLPFNLNWADSRDRLARLLGGTGAAVKERRVAGNREIWTVEGLLRAPPKPEKVLLTFLDDALVAIELQFGQADWETEKFNETMGTLRRQIERDLNGPGDLVKRESEPVPSPDGSQVQQTLTGYEWKRNETQVELFYFAAEDVGKKESFRTISVHYRYTQPPTDDPAAQTGLPGTGAGSSNASPLFPGNSNATKPEPDPLPKP